jgi:signal transduction histidine kinase
MWRRIAKPLWKREPETGGRLHQLVEAGDTRELARRAMTLQSVLLDLHRQLATSDSQEQLAVTMGLALTGSFGCERLVVLRAERPRHPYQLVSQTGDVSPALRVAAPEVASALAPFLPHVQPLAPLAPPFAGVVEAAAQRATKLGIVRAAWLNVDDQVDWLVLVGPKLAGGDYDEFDRTLLQATFDAAALACSRLLLVDALQLRNQELEDANARLLHIDDLKSAILIGVGHEMRTPLTRIQSYAEALRAGEVGADETKAFLDVILRSTQQLATHVEGALSYAQLIGGRTAPKQRRVVLHTVVEEAVDAHRPIAAERGIQLESTCNPLAVVTDPEYVRVILKNLVDNALKFTPRGGRVQVELVPENAGASVRVHDTGPGIPEEARLRIWRLFERGDTSLRREQAGLGLGLALAQRLALELGVQLELLQSSPEGSVFSLFFQDAAPGAEQPALQQEQTVAESAAEELVLVRPGR